MVSGYADMFQRWIHRLPKGTLEESREWAELMLVAAREDHIRDVAMLAAANGKDAAGIASAVLEFEAWFKGRYKGGET